MFNHVINVIFGRFTVGKLHRKRFSQISELCHFSFGQPTYPHTETKQRFSFVVGKKLQSIAALSAVRCFSFPRILFPDIIGPLWTPMKDCSMLSHSSWAISCDNGPKEHWLKEIIKKRDGEIKHAVYIVCVSAKENKARRRIEASHTCIDPFSRTF